MELVRQIVLQAMPSLSNDLMDSLMARLEVIGVNGVDDLNFVNTEDVEGILPPIQCRRLIQAFSAGTFFFLSLSNSNPSALYCLYIVYSTGYRGYRLIVLLPCSKFNTLTWVQYFESTHSTSVDLFMLWHC